MTDENRNNAHSTMSVEDTKTMKKFGITRTPIDYFYLGKYRYTDLKDAIAQAQRQNSTS